MYCISHWLYGGGGVVTGSVVGAVGAIVGVGTTRGQVRQHMLAMSGKASHIF